MEKTQLSDLIQSHAQQVEQALERRLSHAVRDGEIARPERLMAAMRHGTLNGGKRIRPSLVIQSASLFGINETAALPTAMALECVHCYSLVHDDLPDMDDDDLRRGKPTVHKAFDPATAILAGDSLLTLAFEVLGEAKTHADSQVRCDLVVALARASGLGGMAGGQMLDLSAETEKWDEAQISTMQAMKTGALIRFACEAGALLGKATENERRALVAYGEAIGRAFQLADDILDVTASTETLGKTAAKDIDAEKETLVSLYGVERARAMASDLVDQAISALCLFGDRANSLKAVARFIIEREH